MSIENRFKKDLQRLDEKLFYLINRCLKNPFLDWLMPVITNEHNYRVLFLPAFILLLIFGTRIVRVATLLSVLAIALTDQTCNQIKRRVRRKRPCLILPDVNKLVNVGPLSFPSNHSANNCATAVVVSCFSIQLGMIFWGLTLLIGLSRVYCGVHYPLDVLVGLLIGALIALGVCLAYFRLIL